MGMHKSGRSDLRPIKYLSDFIEEEAKKVKPKKLNFEQWYKKLVFEKWYPLRHVSEEALLMVWKDAQENA